MVDHRSDTDEPDSTADGDPEYYHERHESGVQVMYSSESPDTPLCSGKGGTCRNTINPEQTGSGLCAPCRARRNLNNTEVPAEV